MAERLSKRQFRVLALLRKLAKEARDETIRFAAIRMLMQIEGITVNASDSDPAMAELDQLLKGNK